MDWLYVEPEGIEYKVNEEWLSNYFEKNIKYSILTFPEKKPLYNNFADWFEDYGYTKGRQVYIAAKEANMITETRVI